MQAFLDKISSLLSDIVLSDKVLETDTRFFYKNHKHKSLKAKNLTTC